jgi:protein disulfide-isomerase
MKRTLSALALTAVAALASADGSWLTSYDAALKQSKKTGRPILVDFTGSDWCRYCVMLEDEVFSKPAFRKWAKDRVVLLRLDFPRAKPQPKAVAKANQDIAMRYRITGFPTILFLTANGDVVGKYGYDRGGATYWTKTADLILQNGLSRARG